MSQVVRRSLLVREVWGSNLELIKFPTRYQQLATVAALMCGLWRKAAEMAPLTRDIERVLSKYNEDLIFFRFDIAFSSCFDACCMYISKLSTLFGFH